MNTSYFKIEEKLDNSSSYVVWRAKVDLNLEENDVLEYVEGKEPEPLENYSATIKSKYNKGEVKAKKIIIESLRDHLVTYVAKLKKFKEMYDRMVGMYEVKNLNHILSLKNQFKDIKMKKGETVQSYFMRISQLKDQLFSSREITSDREIVLIALGGLAPIWDTFITTIRKNDMFPSFDELMGNCTQEETKMISRGRIKKQEEGEPTTFVSQGKKRKGRGRPSNSRNPTPTSKDSNRRHIKYMPQVQCYNFHKYGPYA